MINFFPKWIKNTQAWVKSGLVFVFFGILISLASCQSNPSVPEQVASGESGFGGTGQKLASVSGFGGTGQKLASLSGFGGTGKTSSGFGGTGIVGTITGFGSIWVNGIEIGYGQQTQITSNLKQESALKRGQQVVLETLPIKDKTLTQKIHIFYPIAGRVTGVKSNQIEIDHQYHVQITPKTYQDTGLLLQKGQYIAVNGYQTQAKVWTATRLNHNPTQQSFYQPVPKLDFSPQVTRVVIEAGLEQFKHWEFGRNLQREVHNAGRVVMEAREFDAHLRPMRVEPYEGFIKQQEQREIREMNQLREHQQELRDLHGRSGQYQQLEELKGAQEQQRSMQEMQEVQSQQQNMREMQEGSISK